MRSQKNLLQSTIWPSRKHSCRSCWSFKHGRTGGRHSGGTKMLMWSMHPKLGSKPSCWRSWCIEFPGDLFVNTTTVLWTHAMRGMRNISKRWWLKNASRATRIKLRERRSLFMDCWKACNEQRLCWYYMQRGWLQNVPEWCCYPEEHVDH